MGPGPVLEAIMLGVGVDGRDRARASISRRLSSSSSSSLSRRGGGEFAEDDDAETCLWKSFGLEGGPSVDIGRGEARRDEVVREVEDKSGTASSFSSSA